MNEKDLQYKFGSEWIDTFKYTIGAKNLRLYALELPIRTEDGEKYADLVYEIPQYSIPMKNKMIVVELKKDVIDTGVVDQVLRYSTFIKKQLYRKQKITSFIAGPNFSNWEISVCRDQGVFALQYDLQGNMRVL